MVPKETVANNQYAKVDASNIGGNESTWRTKLDVYSKTETNIAIAKAKETVTSGDGISAETILNNWGWSKNIWLH